MVRTPCFHGLGAWVGSLVGETRSCMLCSAAKKKKKGKKKKMKFPFPSQLRKTWMAYEGKPTTRAFWAPSACLSYLRLPPSMGRGGSSY